MIKNIILDVGMVLVDFCWEELFQKLGFCGEVFDAVAAATVRSPGWNEFDRSVQTDEELLAGFQKAAGPYRKQVKLFWDRMAEMIVQYPYASDWIASLKEAGYRVYILSNYSRRTYSLTKEDGLSFLPLADGAVFSFEAGFIKPEKEIYHLIMEKFNLDPQACVFIDDNAANLVYPEKIGWKTILFTSFSKAAEELEKLGVKTDPGVLDAAGVHRKNTDNT